MEDKTVVMTRMAGREDEQASSEGVSGKYTMSVAVMLTGVEAHRIRRFEVCGLLKPARTEGGQRLYSDPEIEFIREIAKLENEGINMPGVKVILAMRLRQR